MNILAQKFNTRLLIKYVIPTISMMLFMSAYTIIDGVFVANLVGEDGLSAVNMVMPIINFLLAVGLMFATGGTAIMGNLMGKKKESEARSFLSVLYIIAFILGIIFSTIILMFPDNILRILGVSEGLFLLAKDYLIALSFFCVSFFLQIFVQLFFVLAGKPLLGFISCLSGGVANIMLDYVFISPNMMDLGIKGAGLATGMGNTLPAIIGIIYFLFNRKGVLYFEKPILKLKMLFQSLLNGSSELVSQLSTAVTTLLFNVILLKLVGERGVASISVILYIQMFQTAIIMGYCIGIAPIISYKHGAKDVIGLKNVLKISFKFISLVSVAVISCSLLFGNLAVLIFIPEASETFKMAENGLKIFSISYIFMGFNIFISALFTALSNGKVSAILSFLRTLVFLVGTLVIIPNCIGINGVWLSVPIAELLAFIVSIYFYKKYKKTYQY